MVAFVALLAALLGVAWPELPEGYRAVLAADFDDGAPG